MKFSPLVAGIFLLAAAFFCSADASVSKNVDVIVTHTPQPVISVVPAAPSIDDSAAKGATVYTVGVILDNGAPYLGSLVFGPPNGNANGIFAIMPNGTTQGSWLVVIDPAGPGINQGPATDHTTVVAP
jgi:hypothetical protein